MYKYEITKYNPKFRGENRNYLKEEWTAISDIGKSFEGEILTIEKYKQVEDTYIKSIQIVMDYLGIPYLMINNVIRSFSYQEFLKNTEKFEGLYPGDLIEIYENTSYFQRLDKEKVDPYCRLLLREDIGSDVYFPRKMKVFIGYDYLMGIHTSESIETLRSVIEQLGLFVEEH